MHTIAAVTSRIERFEFNTAISAMMELSNTMIDTKGEDAAKNLVQVEAGGEIRSHLVEEPVAAQGGVDAGHLKPDESNSGNRPFHVQPRSAGRQKAEA